MTISQIVIVEPYHRNDPLNGGIGIDTHMWVSASTIVDELGVFLRIDLQKSVPLFIDFNLTSLQTFEDWHQSRIDHNYGFQDY